VTLQYPDGTTKTEILEFSKSDAEAPDADVIEKLAKITSLPARQLAAALRNTP
jgi:hypothetical protein